MKIQCDVCDKDEASIFCIADEAALCAACDRRVHHANKLAGKHQRFSLHHPSPKQSPLCDICQERRAFLFCQQDRAILCKDCDIQIHKANVHTQKHSRFLLTGVTISATSTVYSESSSSSPEPSSSTLTKTCSDSGSKTKSQSSKNKPVSANPPVCTPSINKGTIVESAPVTAPEGLNGSISTSSISEYLMEMLPGWHFEDFLDSSSYDFCQNQEKDMRPIWDADLENNMSVFPTEKMGFWVPQVAPALDQTQYQSAETTTIGLKEQSKEFASNNIKSSRKRDEDNSFAVPQIIPSSTAFKRSRNFW
ncbi:hypothetical protein CDL12_05598 [Handroanthus impetiginosus]|uniref:B box-type domain-containing protein n=1 Tax=Handroanthus impetiginosus TaxID=429701 RepID=A0A2G9HVZ6_9LAMI|nr:hypothetical protein CDL12_05598 [Handroanthus impetiginosus]